MEHCIRQSHLHDSTATGWRNILRCISFEPLDDYREAFGNVWRDVLHLPRPLANMHKLNVNMLGLATYLSNVHLHHLHVKWRFNKFKHPNAQIAQHEGYNRTS